MPPVPGLKTLKITSEWLKWWGRILASDWLRVITWPGYWLMWWGRLGTILICIRVLLTVSRNHFVSPIVEMLGHLMTILRLTKVDMCWSRMGLCHLYSSRSQWTNQSRWHLKTRGQTPSDRDNLSLLVSASSRPSPGGYWPLIGWEWSRDPAFTRRRGGAGKQLIKVFVWGSGVTNMASDGWKMWQIWEED